MSRAEAIAHLVAMNHPAVQRDLEAVLRNEAEPPRIRALAALSLARVPSSQVQQILIDATASRSEQVLTAVMRALGRVGAEAALRAIDAATHLTGVAAYQARFAASLISHRLGQPGRDLPVPDRAALMELPAAAARRFDVRLLTAEEASRALASLSRERFGIEYDETRLHEIRCAGNRWILAFNRDISAHEGFARLLERPALPAVVASWQSENETFSVRFLVLTAPDGAGGVRIHVHRLTGEPVFFGVGTTGPDAVTFSLRSVDAPGAFPVVVEGRYAGRGRVTFDTALSALFVAKWRRPQPGGALSPRHEPAR